MAALAAQPTRSRKFIKVYLIAWALVAAGALTYLTLLAFPSSAVRQAAQPAAAPEAAAEAGPTLRALAKSFAEMGVAVRRGFSDAQKDITHLKEVTVEQDGRTKAVETRLSALEERVAAVETAQAEAKPAGKGKTSDAKPAPKAPPAKTSEAAPRTPNVINAPPPSAPPAAATRVSGPAPIETGSIPAKEIVFGEPVVTPTSGTVYAVQLAASPTMDGLRQRWDELVDRHGSLATLQPRVVEARGGGPYRLVAGPLQTKSDADRLCADMRAARTTCFATPYSGSPL